MKRYIVNNEITLKEFLEILKKDKVSEIKRIAYYCKDMVEVLAE